MKNSIYPCCLTIAGSDSGGNAGVQADLRAFHAYGLHGCTVFAALTAQNPFGVSAIHAVPSDFVAAQLDAVLGVYSIKALKTGMLADPVSIEIIADRLAKHPEIAKVIDPVMIATSGAKLVSDDAMDVIKAKLLPLATLITPNLPEAETLAGVSGKGRAADVAWAEELGRRLHDKFGCSVLVKGGHGANSAAVDVLVTARHGVTRPLKQTRHGVTRPLEEDGVALEGAERLRRDPLTVKEFEAPWIANPISTHGTGCSLAAALASELALGRGISAAVRGAKDYVHKAIANSYLVGPDCGVLGFVNDIISAHERTDD